MTTEPRPTEDAADALLAAVEEILPDVPPDEVTVDKSLADLGADSVDRVEILSALQVRLGRADPLSVYAELPDIGALMEFLTEGEDG